MNEKLKELMVEAGYAAPEIALRAQKLAELIVQECVTRCEFVANQSTITNTGEIARKTKATADSCAMMINNRFGVN